MGKFSLVGFADNMTVLGTYCQAVRAIPTARWYWDCFIHQEDRTTGYMYGITCILTYTPNFLLPLFGLSPSLPNLKILQIKTRHQQSVHHVMPRGAVRITQSAAFLVRLQESHKSVGSQSQLLPWAPHNISAYTSHALMQHTHTCPLSL